MTKKLSIAVPVLVVGLLAGATACASPAPPEQHATESAAADPIIGEWTMTTLEFGTEGDRQTVPFSGQIIFTEAGDVAVQAMNPDASAADTAYTLGGYEAFYGPVTIDEAAGTFEIDVESAVARDLIGQSLTRNYDVSDDTLVLTPTDPSEGWRVTYERASE
jgi:Lipocalin-like domain